MSLSVCVCVSAVLIHYIATPIKDFHLSNAIRGIRKGQKVVEGMSEKKKNRAGRERSA